LNKIYPFIDGVTLLFGSYAKGTETKDSDLDLVVAGTANEKKISKIAQMYAMEVNVHVCAADAFGRTDPRDTLLTEAKKHHIAGKDTELFVRSVIA
jgi:predicted nucleotidyltransferase